jgi:hypothetical protein
MMGWIGWAWCFAGTYLIGCKRKSGFVVSLVGELWLIAHGLDIGDNSLIVAAIAWSVLLMYNWCKWWGEEKDNACVQAANQAGHGVDRS